jgi:hypothetical protein
VYGVGHNSLNQNGWLPHKELAGLAKMNHLNNLIDVCCKNIESFSCGTSNHMHTKFGLPTWNKSKTKHLTKSAMRHSRLNKCIFHQIFLTLKCTKHSLNYWNSSFTFKIYVVYEFRATDWTLTRIFFKSPKGPDHNFLWFWSPIQPISHVCVTGKRLLKIVLGGEKTTFIWKSVRITVVYGILQFIYKTRMRYCFHWHIFRYQLEESVYLNLL